MQKRNDETTTYPIADLMNYRPSSSAGHTAPVAVMEPWSGVGDDPASSFTPRMTEAQRATRHMLDTRRLRHTLIIGGVVALTIALVAWHVIGGAITANSSYQTAYVAQQTGWVSTDPTTPIALTVLPCQHAGNCTDIAVDVTVQDAPGSGLDPHEYRLGGHLVSDHELQVWGTYGGVTYSADILMSQPLHGNITSGKAQLTFKRGAVATVYQMRAATVQEQTDIFGGH